MRAAVPVAALAMLMASGGTQAYASRGSADRQPEAADRQPAGRPAHLVNPRRFRIGDFGREVLEEIRANMAADVDFAAHFSTSQIACGIACETWFLVDRHNGDVFAISGQLTVGLPNDSYDIDDLGTHGDSDLATVHYANVRGEADRCFTRTFRWERNAFTPVSDLHPAQCPQ